MLNNKKRKYESIKGELYDIYMLSRYFRDLYYLNSLKDKKNFISLSKKLHHIADLKFNFVNFSLIKTSNPISFYEFGQTLFEKIYFMKFISKLLNEKNLREKFNSLKIANKDTVMSCGSSVTATTLALAYSLIKSDYTPKIYIGSWSEYGKIK